MGNPKNRTSRSRRDKRRANWKLEAPNLGECPQCHAPKMPHRMCDNCGYYDGKEVRKAASAE